ncbi:pyridoxal phosphate-dependent aminotransferase [Tautonia sociabilis]|uniref:Aminotransferase class I/II-fold pyridoxal phosphate-dependent enzyme n=1 Tax=Tautonia sociabilis TaxID=2080755 RepID=A0A432MD21_9BACT|nr:aminotransferase class I/II-fold pyridoxal phosphate-dependent enzyme [Tautonia sociabilis]RUL82515.1 aminotransferase class I/II-fold pyridoxal phosphate-dependent enzyme [Tautonia sociabilis]
MPRLSSLAQDLTTETAFSVLAVARSLKASGKEVVELEIGDSPFPSTPHAKEAGIEAIRANRTGYCPSLGLPELRRAAAAFVGREFGIEASADHVVVASGAKPFETYFAEALLEPDDGVLIFGPQFPTYVPNLRRVGARPVLVPLRAEDRFRPQAKQIATFLRDDPKPRAIFLNSPHNPTGGVATAEDLDAIADIVRGTDLVVLSDEPYCHMVWEGTHESLLARPGMMDHVVAAYTMSKSYSMSGWRAGFAVAHPEVVQAMGKLINTSASCCPPFVQLGAVAALEQDSETRDDYMGRFRRKVERLSDGLSTIEGVAVSRPAGTFYVFPDVREICNRLGLTSHGLAMYLLEGADDGFGVACLGGECFGPAGAGFLRFSCAEPDEAIDRALAFLPEALRRADHVRRYRDQHPEHVLTEPYSG